MSVKNMARYLDKTGLLRIDEMRFPVRCIDVKMSYGNMRILVEPVNGEGRVWVDASRVRVVGDESA